MASISPTSRTLSYIRKRGWICDKVEMFNPYAGKFGHRKDFLHFADIIALGDGKIIAVQSCGQAFAEHHRKLTEDDNVAENVQKWLECGGELLLIGWRKIKIKRGGKAKRWSPRIRRYSLKNETVQYKDEK